jgi:hypothetical protein
VTLYGQPELDDDTARMAVEVATEAVQRGRAVELRTRRRRRNRVVMTGTALVLAGGVGAAAAAGVWTTRTGEFGPGNTTETDTSEYLDTAAPDFPDLLRSKYPDLALPEGVDMEQLVQQQVNGLRSDGGTYVQETGLGATAVSFAMCHWQDVWLRADEAGDEEVARIALARLRELPERPELAEADKFGGVVERQRRLAAAALAGDRTTVLQDMGPNCTGWVK